MQALIMEGATSVRGISRALRPIALELGLIHALRTLVAELVARSDLNIQTHLPRSLPVLAGSVERGLYRIAQEALNNAVLHAHATEVQLSLIVTQGQMLLQVADNGQGFAADAPSVSRGLGMLGMNERARQLGARISIDSAPRQGTRVRLELTVDLAGKDSVA
jgi:signal transduction histidine kinase